MASFFRMPCKWGLLWTHLLRTSKRVMFIIAPWMDESPSRHRISQSWFYNNDKGGEQSVLQNLQSPLRKINGIKMVPLGHCLMVHKTVAFGELFWCPFAKGGCFWCPPPPFLSPPVPMARWALIHHFLSVWMSVWMSVTPSKFISD